MPIGVVADEAIGEIGEIMEVFMRAERKSSPPCEESHARRVVTRTLLSAPLLTQDRPRSLAAPLHSPGAWHAKPAVLALALLLAPSLPAQESAIPAAQEKTAAAARQKTALPAARSAAEEFHAAKLAAFGEMQQAKNQAAARGADGKGQREAGLQWEKENAPRLDALRQQAQALAASAPEPARQPAAMPELPPGTPEEVRALLAHRVRTWNAQAAVEQQAGADPARAEALRRDWNSGADARQAEQALLAKAAAEKSAATPLPVPLPMEIPAGVTPEVRALLEARNAVFAARAAAKQAEAEPLRKNMGVLLDQARQAERAAAQALQQKAAEAGRANDE